MEGAGGISLACCPCYRHGRGSVNRSVLARMGAEFVESVIALQGGERTRSPRRQMRGVGAPARDGRAAECLTRPRRLRLPLDRGPLSRTRSDLSASPRSGNPPNPRAKARNGALRPAAQAFPPRSHPIEPCGRFRCATLGGNCSVGGGTSHRVVPSIPPGRAGIVLANLTRRGRQIMSNVIEFQMRNT